MLSLGYMWHHNRAFKKAQAAAVWLFQCFMWNCFPFFVTYLEQQQFRFFQLHSSVKLWLPIVNMLTPQKCLALHTTLLLKQETYYTPMYLLYNMTKGWSLCWCPNVNVLLQLLTDNLLLSKVSRRGWDTADNTQESRRPVTVIKSVYLDLTLLLGLSFHAHKSVIISMFSFGGASRQERPWWTRYTIENGAEKQHHYDILDFWYVASDH